MDRKEFVKKSLALGVTVSIGIETFGNLIPASEADRKSHPLKDIMGIDAHSHPYHFHTDPIYGRLRNLNTTSTVKRMTEAGLVASVFAAVGDTRSVADDPSGSLYVHTLDQLKKVIRFEEKNKLRLLKTKSDLQFSEDIHSSFGAILAIEGGDALQGELDNLTRFYEHGVRVITVMHKIDNEIGYNQESQSDGPLTPFGIKVVEKMNEIGMMVDTAHSNTKTLKSISEVSLLPLLDSHTAPFPDGEENSFPNRARSWEEMELIAKSGGLIGVMPISYKLGSYSRTALADLAKEIVMMRDRLGIEHVGMGSDSGGLPQLVDGWDSISSLPNLVSELLEQGMSEDETKAFAGGNFLRIARESIF